MENRPKVLIFMEGGIIQHTASTHDIEIILVDYDTEGAELEYIKTIEGEKAYIGDYTGSNQIDAEYVEGILDEIKTQIEEDEDGQE